MRELSRSNAHVLEAARVLAGGDSVPPALAHSLHRWTRTGLDLRLGRKAWHDVPDLPEALVRLALTNLTPRHTEPVHTISEAIEESSQAIERSGVQNAAVLELRTYAAVLRENWDSAEAGLCRVFSGSVDRRRVNASRRVGEERRRAGQRFVIAMHPARSELEPLRRTLMTTSVTEPEVVDRTIWRYVLGSVSLGCIDGLQPLVRTTENQRPAPDEACPRALEQAIEAAQACADCADYAAALTVLEDAALASETLTTGYLLELARMASAVSDYERSRIALQIAARADEAAGLAYARQAQLAWVLHDNERVRQAAQRALDHGMPRHSVRTALRRAKDPVTPVDPPTGGIGHVAFYVDRGENFGDAVLPGAVRQVIDNAMADEHGGGRPPAWVPFHAHQLFDDEFAAIANAQRALVVGGGGLFLPDTAPNGNSGWQWNVPQRSLRSLDVPLFVFAVGYNLFRGQQFRGGLFQDNLVALADRAEFIGLRNHGSIDRVRDYLPAELHNKVRYVPCPTTVLERSGATLPEPEAGTGRVLLNVAFDRSAHRFGDRYDSFLSAMAHVVREARSAGAEVRVAAHTRGDTRIAADLHASHGLELPVDALHSMDIGEALAVYRRASLVVGMRGHATMIPFGVGTPVLSIISHPKLRYFLEDIDRTTWGFDVLDENLGERLAEATTNVLAHENEFRSDVAGLQSQLYSHVQAAAVAVATGAVVPAEAGARNH